MIQRHGLSEADFRGSRFERHPQRPEGQLRRPRAHAPGRPRGRSTTPTSRPGPTSSRRTPSARRASSWPEYGLAGSRRRDERRRGARRRARARASGRSAPRTSRASSPAASGRRTRRCRSRPRDDPGCRDVTFDEVRDAYAEQVRGARRGRRRHPAAETSFDTLVMKACLFAIDDVFEETGTRLPVMISGTIFDKTAARSRRSRSRRSILGLALRRPDASASTAPSASTGCGRTIESSRRSAGRRVSCYPNAGMPDGFGGFGETRGHHGRRPGRVRRERLAQHRRRLLRHDAGRSRPSPARVEGVAAARARRLPHWSAYQRHGAARRSAPRPTSS